MIIKKDSDIQEIHLEDEKIKRVTRKILIGPIDGSRRIIMRRFVVLPGGNTPHHSHGFEHVIKFEKGRGIIVNKKGEEIPVSEGHSAYVEPNETHQFKNPYDRPFEFLCVIPNPENPW